MPADTDTITAVLDVVTTVGIALGAAAFGYGIGHRHGARAAAARATLREHLLKMERGEKLLERMAEEARARKGKS